MRSLLGFLTFPWWLTLSITAHLGLVYWLPKPAPPERVIRISVEQGRTAVNLRRTKPQLKPRQVVLEKDLPIERKTPQVTPAVFEIPPPPPAPLPLAIPRPTPKPPEKVEEIKLERATREPEPVVRQEVHRVESPDSVAMSGAVDVQPTLLVNPTPYYPREALLARQTGEVVLRVRVSVEGRAISAVVHRTSGVASLDEAALTTVRERWKFTPARKQNRPVEHDVLVPVQFRISS